MKTGLRVAICEDDPQDAAVLRAFVEREEPAAGISVFKSGGEFMVSSPAGLYDIVFMDIYFNKDNIAPPKENDERGPNGVEIASELRSADGGVEIVFTTSSEAHALEAFKLKALQYLVKPVDGDETASLIRRVSRKLRASQGVCTVLVDGKKTDIPLYGIVYAEVNGFRCVIHTAEGEFTANCSLDSLAKQLPPPGFYRCHRSYIVNFRHVRAIGRDFTMKNGDTVYIRTRGEKETSLAYKMWLMNAVREGEI
jgi:DNA-binding LytR/AlgR family response regulator